MPAFLGALKKVFFILPGCHSYPFTLLMVLGGEVRQICCLVLDSFFEFVFLLIKLSCFRKPKIYFIS